VEELERVAKANPDQAGITLKMVDLAAGNLRLVEERARRQAARRAAGAGA